MSEKVQITTNVARENRLWRAGKRAKLNLVAVQVDALSIVPFPLLYFIMFNMGISDRNNR